MSPTENDLREFWSTRVEADPASATPSADMLAAFNDYRAERAAFRVSAVWFALASVRHLTAVNSPIEARQGRHGGRRFRGWWGARLTS